VDSWLDSFHIPDVLNHGGKLALCLSQVMPVFPGFGETMGAIRIAYTVTVFMSLCAAKEYLLVLSNCTAKCLVALYCLQVSYSGSLPYFNFIKRNYGSFCIPNSLLNKHSYSKKNFLHFVLFFSYNMGRTLALSVGESYPCFSGLGNTMGLGCNPSSKALPIRLSLQK
jgi:hypothetical protein